MQKVGFIAVKHRQTLKTSSRRCCSIVGKRGTHLAHSFLKSKFSVNMRCTALFEMPTMSASLRTFSWRSSNTILWIFFTISVVVTSFGRPLWCPSWQLVRLRLNSAIQYFIVVNEGVDSHRVESNSALILVGLRPFKWSIVSHNDDKFFRCSKIHWERSLLIAVKQILNNVASSNFNIIFIRLVHSTIVIFFKQQPSSKRQVGYFWDYPRIILF